MITHKFKKRGRGERECESNVFNGNRKGGSSQLEEDSEKARPG